MRSPAAQYIWPQVSVLFVLHERSTTVEANELLSTLPAFVAGYLPQLSTKGLLSQHSAPAPFLTTRLTRWTGVLT